MLSDDEILRLVLFSGDNLWTADPALQPQSGLESTFRPSLGDACGTVTVWCAAVREIVLDWSDAASETGLLIIGTVRASDHEYLQANEPIFGILRGDGSAKLVDGTLDGDHSARRMDVAARFAQ